ncbi:MAG: DUF2871 family protein [Cyanobacteria bacterium]|nr:DUF2871 family protein [Cyanobacteriota bacterium]
MEMPAYYAKFYTRFIRFSLVMMIIALLSGVVYQESSKKAPISELLPAGVHLESIFHLSLLHGHVFLMGVLVPMAVVLILHLGTVLKRKLLSEKQLNWVSALYLPCASIAIFLLLLKGYHYLFSVRGMSLMGIGHDFKGAPLSFEVIEQTFFWGEDGLRKLVYAVVHSVLSLGLGIFVVGMWQNLDKSALNTPSGDSV